jgi:hypothetical protein
MLSNFIENSTLDFLQFEWYVTECMNLVWQSVLVHHLAGCCGSRLMAEYELCSYFWLLCELLFLCFNDSVEIVGGWMHSLRSVVGKLLLKSNCFTLLPLLLKETSYFESVTHFEEVLPHLLVIS